MAEFDDERMNASEEEPENRQNNQNNGQSESGGKKKQKKTCLGCFVTVLFWIFSVTFVLNLIVVVAAYFVADHYAKEYLDMSAGEIISVVSGATNSNKNKIVPKQNRYTEADLKSFYTDMKKQVFLSESYDLKGEVESTVIRLVEQYGESFFSSDSDENTGLSSIAGQSSPLDAENEEKDEDKDDMFQTALEGLLKAENFDLARLRGFDYEHPESFTNYVLKDKQLAAFLNDMVNNEHLTAFLDSAIKEETGYALSLRFSVDQVVFFKDNCEYREWSEPNEEGEKSTYQTVTGEVHKMKVTASVHLRELVRSFLRVYDAEKFSYFFNFLPKNVFVSVEIPLDKDAAPMAYLNSMDSGKMKTAFKLAGKLSELFTDGSLDLETTLADMGSNVLYPVIKMANDIVPVRLNEGSITVSPIDILLSMVFSKVDTDIRPEAKDFFLLLQKGIIVDPDEMSEIIENPHRNAYYVTDEVTGERRIQILLTNEEVSDYHAIFDKNPDGSYVRHLDVMYDEISSKYFIDIEDFEDLLDLITGGIVDGDQEKLLETLSEKFSSDNFRDAYGDEEINDDDLKLALTDYMLAELLDLKFSELLDAFIPPKDDAVDEEAEDGATEESFDFKSLAKHLRTDQVVIKSIGEGEDRRSFIKLTVSMPPKSVFEEMQSRIPKLYYDFLIGLCETGQIAEKIFVTAIVDITLAPEDGESEFQSTDTIILLNTITSAQMDKFFAIAEAFGFGADALTQMIDDNVKSVLSQLNNQISIQFVDSAVTKSGAIETSDMFSLIISLAGMKVADGESGERLLSGTEIRAALRAIDYAAELANDIKNNDGIFKDNIPDDTAFLECLRELEKNLFLEGNPLSYDVSPESIENWYGEKIAAEELEEGLDYLEVRRLYINAMNKAAVDRLTGGGIKDDIEEIKFRGGSGLLDIKVWDPEAIELLIGQNAFVGLIESFMASQDLGVEVSVVMARIVKEEDELVLKIMFLVDIQSMIDTAGADGTVSLVRTFMPEDYFYFEASCHLDTIVNYDESSGYQTELDINNLNGSGKVTEFNALMLILESLGISGQLDDVKKTVSKAVYSGLNQMDDNSNIEYTIREDGISLGNIFGLIVKTADLKLEGGELMTDEELWKVLNSMGRGDEIDDRDGDLYGEVFLSSTGGGLSAVVDELEDKYYLKEEASGIFYGDDDNIKSDSDLVATITGDDFDDFYKNIKVDDSIRLWAANELAGLLDDDRKTPALNVKVNSAALLSIIEQKIDVTDLDATVMQISIGDGVSGGHTMEIVMKADRSSLVTESEGITKYLPDDELKVFYFIITCDLGEVVTDDGDSYYATTVDFNYLQGVDNINNSRYADNELFKSFVAGMSDAAMSKIDDAAVAAGRAVFNAINSLENDMVEPEDIGFYTDSEGGGLLLPNVFVLIAKNMNLSVDDYFESLDQEYITNDAEEKKTIFYGALQSALQGVCPTEEDEVEAEIDDTALEDLVVDEPNHLYAFVDLTESIVGISERALGAHFYKICDDRSADDKKVSVLSTKLIEEGGLYYMRVVAKVEFKNGLAQAEGSGVASLMPDYVYGTWTMGISDGSEKFVINSMEGYYETKMAEYIFNKMSGKDQDLIVKALKLTDELEGGFVDSGKTNILYTMIDGLKYLCYNGNELPEVFGVSIGL